MSRAETMNRFDSTTETIKYILKLNYDKIIMEGEINSIVDPVISKNRDYLESQLSRYTYWWSGLLILFVLTFGIANRITVWSESSIMSVDHIIKLTSSRSKPYIPILLDNGFKYYATSNIS